MLVWNFAVGPCFSPLQRSRAGVYAECFLLGRITLGSTFFDNFASVAKSAISSFFARLHPKLSLYNSYLNLTGFLLVGSSNCLASGQPSSVGTTR